ncbi:hypothetical protein GALLR39Z86_31520 [Glycomyces algeriensis]|uniref:Uncharacterized protein n=1 Tax=Glycomyces algeriensis TaxID=256037 RepID=A0A9W6LGS6_9ACTN|nr:hypothetical protein GALLR39Z86_31520 [Glycomyces algeriensis]
MDLADVLHVPGLQMGLLERGDHELVEVPGLRGRVRDDVVLGDVLHCGRSVEAREGVVARGGEDERVPGHEPGVEQVRAGHLAHEADLDLPCQERVELRVRDHLAEDEVDAGQFGGGHADPPPEDGEGRDCGEADADGPGGARGDAAGAQRRGVGRRQEAAGLLEEDPAGGGELGAALGAQEQVEADGALEALDLAAQRRLRHAQSLCGPSEVGLLGDRHKSAELVECVPDVACGHALKVSVDVE